MRVAKISMEGNTLSHKYIVLGETHMETEDDEIKEIGDMIANGVVGDVFVIELVKMTQKQYEELPIFEGFE